MLGSPNKEEAIKIWQEGLDFRIKNYGFPVVDEYVFHTKGIAESCEKIAKLMPDMNSEKAYVLGLLHDYGKKYPEKETGVFHGRRGYDEMMSMGYPDVAEICLTHTFYAPNFSFDSFPSYTLDDLVWAKNKMANITFNDYDLLVQLCDMFFEGLNKVRIEDRFQGIIKRYNLQFTDIENSYNHALENKKYFESKIHTDIYNLLDIV